MKLSFPAGGKAVALTAAAGNVFRKFRLSTGLLPQKFQCQLRNARVSRAANLPDERAIDAQLRSVELCMIEEIKKLGAKLKRDGFGELCVFQERHVPVIQARYFHNVSTGVSERPQRSRRKAARIEVAVDGALVARKVAITRPVRTLEWKPTHVGTVPGDCDTEVVARHEA